MDKERQWCSNNAKHRITSKSRMEERMTPLVKVDKNKDSVV
jgi:hypothetical protein